MKYLRTTVTMFSEDRAVDEFYDGYFVRQAFQLRKDSTRELAQYLTPDEAERIGQELIEQARLARERTATHQKVT